MLLLPDYLKEISIKTYSADQLTQIPNDYRHNGVSFIVIPAGSNCLMHYAQHIANAEGLYNTPLVGWVSGLDLNSIGVEAPKVYHGSNTPLTNAAVVMHCELPNNKFAELTTINLFRPGLSDIISFPESGFVVRNCRIGDQNVNFANYIRNNKIDTSVPLVANYLGTSVNVSIQSVDHEKDIVNLYAPVDSHHEYRFAAVIENFEDDFRQAIGMKLTQPDYSFNCILNYVNAGLEGKAIPTLNGPFTFGEIAYLLLNQTVVCLNFKDQ